MGTQEVQYITDSHGKKSAVVLPIEEYDELLEDIHDLAILAERRDEATVPFVQIKDSLQ